MILNNHNKTLNPAKKNMSSSGIVGYYTGFFEALGLSSVLSRFLFGSAIGFGSQLLIKPKVSYHSDGSAKQFLSQTYLPWYILSVIPGAFLALFF